MTKKSGITITNKSDPADDEAFDCFRVSFDIASASTDLEILLVARPFFSRLLAVFVVKLGQIHVMPSRPFADSGNWPRTLDSRVQVQDALDSLLKTAENRPYPLVLWFEPHSVRSGIAPSLDVLQAAGSDPELLDELLAAGFARMFLDDTWADLLSDLSDRIWVEGWIVETASQVETLSVELEIGM